MEPPASSQQDDHSTSSEDEETTRARLRAEAKQAAQKLAKSNLVWNTLNKIWPLEDRPEELQDREHVALLDLEDIKNIREIHKLDKSEAGDKKESMIRDKKPKDVKLREGVDNCFNLLHPGRWLRMPLAPHSDWFFKTPTKRHEIYLSMDLEFTGSHNCVSDRTIIEMHDRRNQMTLKKFLTENINVASKPKVETRTQEGDGSTSTSFDLNWVKPTSLSQVQEAVHNYCSIAHWLWPYDPTGLSFLRIMHKYQWLKTAESHQGDNKARIELIKTFFNLCMKKVANSALNGKCVPSYMEMEDLLKSTLSQNGLSTEIPAFRKQFVKNNSYGNTNSSSGSNNYNKASNSRGKNFNNRGNNRGKGFRNQPKNPGEEPKLWANVNGKGLCYNWNSVEGRNCDHKRVDVGKYKGCEDELGRKFIHLCSEWVQGKDDYCYDQHPRKYHR